MKNLLVNFRRHEPANLTPAETRLLEQDLEAIYATPTPALTWEAALEGAERRDHALPVVGPNRPGRRPVRGLVAAGIVVAALAIAVPFLPGRGGATTVSAQELIDRSEVATRALADGSTSYHMVVEYQLAMGHIMRTETWQDGDAIRTETAFVGADLDGALYGQLTDGETFWYYETRNGASRAVSAPLASANGFGAINPANQGSLADVITNLVVPGCQQAMRDGEATMLGRRVLVVEVKATGRPCGTEEEIAAGLPTKTLRTESTILIDAETFVVLRSEQRDLQSGDTFVTEVTAFEPGATFPEGTFEYVPPAGVTVIHATDMTSLKQALAEPLGDEKGGPVSSIATAESNPNK